MFILINLAQFLQILATQSRSDSIMTLMTELKGCGQHGYVQFYKALMESGQKHLAKYLQLELPNKEDLK